MTLILGDAFRTASYYNAKVDGNEVTDIAWSVLQPTHQWS
jgi:uncharacterized protein (DUF427 family)